MLFNHENYVYFALITPTDGGSWGFTSYADRDGNTYRAISGYHPSGLPRNYDIYWSAAQRVLAVPKNKMLNVITVTGEKRIKEVDYIRNHPFCEGGPNFTDGCAIVIKEIDEQKDSKIHLDRIERQNAAVNEALALEGQALDDMAIMFAVFTDDVIIKRRRVAEYAQKDPEQFFKFYEAGDRPIRALVKKALAANKIQQIGEAIFWGKESLGGNLDQAVSYLVSNPEKLEGLKQSVDIVPTKKKTK